MRALGGRASFHLLPLVIILLLTLTASPCDARDAYAEAARADAEDGGLPPFAIVGYLPEWRFGGTDWDATAEVRAVQADP